MNADGSRMQRRGSYRSYPGERGTALADLESSSPVREVRVKRRDLGVSVYRAVIAHSPDGLLFSSPDGRILAANEAACELLGTTEDEIVAVGRDGVIDSTDDSWRGAVDERRQSGHVRAEVRMRRGDGTVFLANVVSVIFETAEGPRAYVLVRAATDGVPSARQSLPTSSGSHGGDEPLSPRELTVIADLAARMTYREIASDLYIPVNTVKSHVHAIYRKLGVSSRSDAVATADTLGLLAVASSRTPPGACERTHEYEVVCACGNRWRLRVGDEPARVVCAVCGARRPGTLDLGQTRPP